ncbi:bifunctional metallophosphatase/5'-nucleotidase [Stakelama marina]|uniref:Bifunctional metallophosphatase/5'-nucleotidase n=1 Tax=Stakelama marina TaxID=2826939 RepID=A0A8T4IDU3_9SPHN|nr:bifunctional metallophosphatase/5'-nucleotidase [Stakelama marina]MBR0552591.1 bifunctional metallophosphatase/5'-nucleotidase [Stakelama marina]
MKAHHDLFIENGKVVFHKRGGLAHIKTLVDRERAANPGRTLLVDGGDLYQGDGYSVLTKGEDMIAPVRDLGFDMIIPGNWAVVYGKDQMIKLERSFGTTPVAENIYHADNFKPVYQPTLIKEINGVRLGFMGLDDPDVPQRQNPAMSKGLVFSGVDARLKNKIDAFVKDNDIDVMFLVTHLGVFKQIAIADSPVAENVDYVLGNDTHERIRKPLERKYAKVTEPGAFGTFVGKLTLNFDNGKFLGDDYQLIDVDPAKYPADPKMKALVDQAEAPHRAEMEKVIGYTKEPVYRYLAVESPLDDMITDAFRWKTGTQIALSNGFRYGNPVVPENGKPAPITMANLFNWMPINTKLKTGRVKGSVLHMWLEKEINNAFSPNAAERFGGYLIRFSGMRLRFEPSRPKGERIISLTVEGKPVEPDQYYTVTSVIRTGAPESNFNRLPMVEDVKEMPYTVHDAIVEYLGTHSPVAPKLDGRAYSEELGTMSLSTIPGADYEFR